MVNKLKEENSKLKSYENYNHNNLINNQELNLLNDKISKVEQENNNLIYVHNEESRKNRENFILLMKLFQNYLNKTKNSIFILKNYMKLKLENVSDNKTPESIDINKLFQEIDLTFDNLDNLLNENYISENKSYNNSHFNDISLNCFDLNKRLNEEIVKNNNYYNNQIFDFIEIINKLETKNQLLEEKLKLNNFQDIEEV